MISATSTCLYEWVFCQLHTLILVPKLQSFAAFNIKAIANTSSYNRISSIYNSDSCDYLDIIVRPLKKVCLTFLSLFFLVISYKGIIYWSCARLERLRYRCFRTECQKTVTAGIRGFSITWQHFVSRTASLPAGWLSSKWKRNAASREAEEDGTERGLARTSFGKLSDI